MAESRWPDILEGVALGIMALDPKAERVLWKNQAMSELLSSPGEGQDGLEERFVSGILAGIDWAGQQAIELGNKTIGFSAYPTGEGVHLVLATAISKKERRRRLSQAGDLIRVLDYLFFNLAHEMGNPINSIKMTLEVLINNFAEYNDEVRLEYLESLHAEFRRLEDLLKAIRSYNMFEQLTRKPIDVIALLDNLLQLLDGEIREKSIAIVRDLGTGPMQVLGDPRALQHVLLHLLSNAIDTLAGRNDPRISIRVGRCRDEVQVSIGDNGAGIPAQRQPELFMPFFSGKPQGIGLGLSIVRKLLTQMDGTIEIDSTPQEGTEARVSLPSVQP